MSRLAIIGANTVLHQFAGLPPLVDTTPTHHYGHSLPYASVYRRVNPDTVCEIPAGWHKFLGSYGPEFIPLVISARHGHLYGMTEYMVDYRLTPLNRLVFKMCPGMYEDEQLVFQVSPLGRVQSAVLAGMELPRTSP